MVEVLKVALDNFWSWTGTFLLVALVVSGIGAGLHGLIRVNVIRK